MRTRDGGDDGSHPMILAYAESTDGVTWTKPSIGTVELDGSKENNLVYGLNVARGRSVNSASVFKDPTGGPNERYKLLYRDPTERQSPNLYGAVSPDGLHWGTLDEPLITNYFSDTHNVVGYDPKRGQYVAYVRGWTEFGPGALHGRRTIAHAASDTNDLRRGRSGRAGHGHLHERLHSLAGRRRLPDVPGVLPAECRHRRDPNAHGTGRSELGAPDSGADGARRGAGNAFGGWLLRRFGSRELPARRGLAAHLRDLAHSQRGSLRRNTDIRHTWRTLVDRDMADGRLRIAGGAGRRQLRHGAHHVRGRKADDQCLDPVRREISFELADASSEHMGKFGQGVAAETATAISGRSFDDCDAFTGDSTCHTVTWNGESDISQWANRPMRLRVRMRRARLYAIQTM